MKTVRNNAAVADFLASINHQKRVEDAKMVMRLMEEVTGLLPSMWGRASSVMGPINTPTGVEKLVNGLW